MEPMKGDILIVTACNNKSSNHGFKRGEKVEVLKTTTYLGITSYWCSNGSQKDYIHEGEFKMINQFEEDIKEPIQNVIYSSMTITPDSCSDFADAILKNLRYAGFEIIKVK